MLKGNPFPCAYALKIYPFKSLSSAFILSIALIIISYSILHPNSLIEKSYLLFFPVSYMYLLYIYNGMLKENSFPCALKIYIHLNASTLSIALIIISYSTLHLNSLIKKSYLLFFTINLISYTYLIYIYIYIYNGMLKGNSFLCTHLKDIYPFKQCINVKYLIGGFFQVCEEK